MKTLFLILAMTLTFSTFSQEEKGRIDFYLGFDVPNLVRGGKLVNGEPRNNSALDIKGGWTLTDGRIAFGTYLEYFEAIDYFAAGVKLGSPFRIVDVIGETDLVITPSAQTEWVWRDGLPDEVIPENVTVKESLNWGVSLDIQIDQLFGNDSPWYAEWGLGLKYRHDKYNIWGRDVDPSGTIPALWENRELYFLIGFEVFKKKDPKDWKKRGG